MDNSTEKQLDRPPSITRQVLTSTWFSWAFLIVFRLFRTTVRLLPSRFMLWLTSRLTMLAGLFFPKEHQIIRAQIRFVQSQLQKDRKHSDDSQSKNLVESLERLSMKAFSHNVFAQLGELLGETLIFDRLCETVAHNESTAEFPRFKYIDHFCESSPAEIFRSHQAALFLTGHIGNFELLTAYYVRCGAQVTIVGKRPNYPFIDALLAEVRRSYGTEVVWRQNEDSGASPKGLLTAVKKGRCLGIVIDHDTNVENGFYPFFGLEAATPVTPLKLAVKYQLPVFTTFLVRKERMRYHAFTRHVHYEGEEDKAIRHIVACYNKHLEELILSYPDQWLWTHRRWRRRPGINYRGHAERIRTTDDYIAWINSLTLANEKE